MKKDAVKYVLALVLIVLACSYACAADCGCGGKCGATCCTCGPTVTAALKAAGTPTATAPKTDDERYAWFREGVTERSNLGSYILVVGPAEAPREYAVIYRFPSGFKGIADGVYDCFKGADGRPMMLPRAAPQPMAGPAMSTCPGGKCPAPGTAYRVR